MPVTAGGSTVSASVHVTVGSSPASIVIVSPTAGEVVVPSSTNHVPVAFHVANFMLAALGSCAGMPNCGHVHLIIDGTGCNASGSPYNNAGAASPIDANLGACATATGVHTVALELHNDDHTAVIGKSYCLSRPRAGV